MNELSQPQAAVEHSAIVASPKRPRVKWSPCLGPEWDLPRWKRRIRQLRKDFPADCRVVIRLVPVGSIKNEEGDPLHGVTIFKEKSCEIRVARQADISLSIAVLWHEWSHVLAPPNRKNHHQQWRDVLHRIETHYLGD